MRNRYDIQYMYAVDCKDLVGGPLRARQVAPGDQEVFRETSGNSLCHQVDNKYFLWVT